MFRFEGHALCQVDKKTCETEKVPEIYQTSMITSVFTLQINFKKKQKIHVNIKTHHKYLQCQLSDKNSGAKLAPLRSLLIHTQIITGIVIKLRELADLKGRILKTTNSGYQSKI